MIQVIMCIDSFLVGVIAGGVFVGWVVLRKLDQLAKRGNAIATCDNCSRELTYGQYLKGQGLCDICIDQIN